MNKKNWLLTSAFLFCCTFFVQAQRESILLNNDWKFRFSHQVQKNSWRRIDLPHTWNAQDALVGQMDYKRGVGNYEKKLFIHPEWQGRRIFLRFEGANTVTNVFVNGKHLGEHRGGYGAFIFELTGKVNYGEQNTLLVRVNNAEQLDVMPLLGDFNMYGGIYRDVHLLITDNLCISPLDYASPGVYLMQQKVTPDKADVEARINLSNIESTKKKAELKLTVLAEGKTVLEKKKALTLKENTDVQESIPFAIDRPILWDGRENPFIYQAVVTLSVDGKEIDRVEQPLGLRFYHVDPNEGFFLNGKHLKLRGICRHQDRAEVGNALRTAHHEEDAQLMLEMGANAIRLAHYPQSETIYNLMDTHGVVVWAEIPFIGPGGYADKGFVDQPSFRHNGKEQLKELIRQHYNHPSICFWGLFNELKEVGDNPLEYIRELDQLAKAEDPTRITTSATNINADINYITQLIAWNRYDGWYGSTPATLATFLDRTHQNRPELRIGISEYGAGASIYHQQDSLVQTVPSGWWHPENWQTYYHMENWKIIQERPFVWGSFVWNMFDFGAAHRTEGDRPGINDKGLVTFDRKVKKDAFYFYKANWNKAVPTLYLAEKRVVNRHKPEQSFMVFTNLSQAELYINGVSQGTKTPDEYCTIRWENIKLQPGKNCIEVKAPDGSLSDGVEVMFAG
ncbi:glycoside hydrolase family 2 protein [Bacteroides sp. OttesenSCG-928-E20]|nr:glycoside hydrolase family 2 protein [Bacteroides sp. OttesenSCG-928-N06]MDL2299075.1 glycoside hydrolase family 2 protein [Bacteroides sp. OttesenSCG-928-E20]MDL2306269.1 glycoside hydrolase family 2 protein [Bacteroides sp. OttesenSCG-928-D19]